MTTLEVIINTYSGTYMYWEKHHVPDTTDDIAVHRFGMDDTWHKERTSTSDEE